MNPADEDRMKDAVMGLRLRMGELYHRIPENLDTARRSLEEADALVGELVRLLGLDNYGA
jgi:hypothetical protein